MILYAQNNQQQLIKEQSMYIDKTSIIINKKKFEKDPNYNDYVLLFPKPKKDKLNYKLIIFKEFTKSLDIKKSDGALLSLFWNIFSLTQFKLKEIESWTKDTKYNKHKHQIHHFMDDKAFYELLNNWLKISSELAHVSETMKNKYIYISLDIKYFNENYRVGEYTKIINKLQIGNKITLDYPTLIKTKFDSSMYNNTVLFDETYKIDNNYPRFCIFRIPVSNIKTKIKWIKLCYDYGIIFGGTILISFIKKITLVNESFGYIIDRNDK